MSKDCERFYILLVLKAQKWKNIYMRRLAHLAMWIKRVLESKNSHKFQIVILTRILCCFRRNLARFFFHIWLDFCEFSTHFVMSSLRYTTGIPLEFSKIPLHNSVEILRISKVMSIWNYEWLHSLQKINGIFTLYAGPFLQLWLGSSFFCKLYEKMYEKNSPIFSNPLPFLR